MKTKKLFLAVCMLTSAILHLTSLNSFAQGKRPTIDTQSRDVSFTLEDRDRIMQTQKEVASMRNEMNTRFESQRNEMMTKFESVDKRIETLYWGFGIMISIMLFLFGYIVFDRKTSFEPLREKSYLLSEKYIGLVHTLKEYAKEQPKLSEILKAHGIL